MPQRKAKASPLTQRSYYLANKERMDAARKQSDKNRLALRKSKMAQKTKEGRDLRRFHKNVSSCHYYGTEVNCSKDMRCKWSDKTKPKCRSKSKNIFKVPDLEERAARKAIRDANKPPSKKVAKKQISSEDDHVVEYFKAKNGRNMVRYASGKVKFAKKGETGL